MLRIKDGVQPKLIELVVALANVVEARPALPEVWITSGIDGIHSKNSLHYALRAIDVRTHNLTEVQTLELIVGLKKELGPQYDVIWEHKGTPNSHLHLEFDPK